MVCKGKKKDRAKTSKEAPAAKLVSAAVPPPDSIASAAPPVTAPATPAKPLPAIKRAPRIKPAARRNYFKGDERYRTTVAAGMTTIAGGGKVDKKDDAEQAKKTEQFLENWYVLETELLQDGSSELPEEATEPDEADLKKGAAAQERLIQLEKKFGSMMLTALIKGEARSSDNKSLNDLPAPKPATEDLEDPRYEARWW